jgi:hypothetical protein
MDSTKIEERKRDIKPTNKVIRCLFEEPSLEEREAEKIAQEQQRYRDKMRKEKRNITLIS